MRTLIALLGLAGMALASPLVHSTSSSQYIHSNDTIEMHLVENANNKLSGAPGSEVSLEFVVINRFTGAHFTFEQASEDNFRGVLSIREGYLQQDQQQTITVSRMVVPQRDDDQRVKFTLTAKRDNMKRKKRQVGGSGSNTDSGSNGGDNNNGGRPGILFPNRPDNNQLLPNVNDPSFRRELSLTVEFIVTSDYDNDNRDPWVKLTYFAEKEEETCRAEPGDANCDQEEWWTKFRVQDEDSGLAQVRFTATGGTSNNKEPIYYRYENFAIGTDGEYEIVAAASCCLEGIELRVTDVEGNSEEIIAENGGTGTPLSKAAKWGIIGAIIALVVIVLIGVGACCYKKKYSAVSSD